jgi:hypothetical protein
MRLKFVLRQCYWNQMIWQWKTKNFLDRAAFGKRTGRGDDAIEGDRIVLAAVRLVPDMRDDSGFQRERDSDGEIVDEM